jgi:hypothetical protein
MRPEIATLQFQYVMLFAMCHLSLKHETKSRTPYTAAVNINYLINAADVGFRERKYMRHVIYDVSIHGDRLSSAKSSDFVSLNHHTISFCTHFQQRTICYMKNDYYVEKLATTNISS